MRIHLDIDLKQFRVSPVLRFFIIADLMFFSGWGIVNPIFSIFVIEKIPGATLATVGIGAAVYWIVKSVIQIPVSRYLDQHEGELDDFMALSASFVLGGFVMLVFLLVHSIAWFYCAVFLQGLAFGLYTPSWNALFSRHLDQKHTAYDWALDSTSVGVAAGITGLFGGLLSNFFGFNIVFIIASLLSFVGALMLLKIPRLIFPKIPPGQIPPHPSDHAPQNINR
jgi:MFS family permease